MSTHNQTIIKSGHVEKKISHSIFNTYKDRYLVLTNNHLKYYHQPDSINVLEPEFCIDLVEIQDVTSVHLEDNNNISSFEIILSNKKITMRCKNNDAESWINEILIARKNCNKLLPTSTTPKKYTLFSKLISNQKSDIYYGKLNIAQLSAIKR
jgi:hypothetical protein